jgi:pimeloyl-ACP methyl ester carboxylesterase
MTDHPTLRRWARRLRRITIVTVVIMLVLVGALVATTSGYERAARRRFAQEHPPTGELVDIGGRRMHLDCRGTGDPTVVFESGLNVYGSQSWTRVHDAIAATTRACTYDRAGMLWSDPSRGVTVADDLHAGLTAAGESGPFVVVGHSVGGAYALAFTQKYRDEVAGLVLVDSFHPDQFARLPQPDAPVSTDKWDIDRLGARLAWTGLTRMATAQDRPENAPGDAGVRIQRYLPTSLAALVAERKAIHDTLQLAGDARNLGSRPLIALTAGDQQSPRQEQVMADMHREIASWSSAGRQETVRDSGSYIQNDQPDAVIAAVREVLEATP